MTSMALVPDMLNKKHFSIKQEVFANIIGLALLIMLAQISIAIPGSPVPITGQTFGVSLLALSWGRKRSVGIFLSYLFLGSIGFPVFASGASGLHIGPTFGYLIGMLLASFLIGFLADIGFTKTFKRAFIATLLASSIIFLFGLIGLSFFIPSKQVISLGLLPFIPGDFLKSFLAALISWQARKRSA